MGRASRVWAISGVLLVLIVSDLLVVQKAIVYMAV